MKFYTVRELRNSPKEIWKNLSINEEAVITNNGKPTALMLGITEENFEKMLQVVHQAKAIIAFNGMRKKAKSEGFMSENEINAEINNYRKEKNKSYGIGEEYV